MLYELIAVVRPGNVNEVKEVARNAGSLILRSRGVVRGLTNWGPFLLPKPFKAYQTYHHTGHYFIMRFDSSAATQSAMCRSLSLDPRMIRFSVIKLADRLGTRGQIAGVEAIQGKVDWMGTESWKDTETGSFMARNSQRLSSLRHLDDLEDVDVD